MRNKLLIPIAVLLCISLYAKVAATSLPWAYEEDNGDNFWNYSWSGKDDGGDFESNAYGNIPVSTVAYQGTGALKFHFTKGATNSYAFGAITTDSALDGSEPESWDEVDTGKDITSHNYLIFYIKAEGSYSQTGRIEIKDTSDVGTGKVTIDNYVSVSSTWQLVQIPLSDFSWGTVNKTSIKNINILCEDNYPSTTGEWTYYIDNLRFSSGLADFDPPGPVTNFTIIPGNGRAFLEWVNPSDSDFLGTMVLRKTGSYPADESDGTIVCSGNLTNYTDTGLTNGVIYYYSTFAYDAEPNYSNATANSRGCVIPTTKQSELKWCYEEENNDSYWNYTWSMAGSGGIVEGNDYGNIPFSNSCAYEGNGSLKFHFTKPNSDSWAFAAVTTDSALDGTEPEGWYEVDKGKNILSCTFLSFWIRGEQPYSQTTKIEIKDTKDKGTSKVAIDSYVTVSTDWQRVDVPLVDFNWGNTNMTSIKNVNIVCDTDYPSGTGEWTFYIDNMRFISAGELSIQKGPNSPAVWYSAPDKTNVVMLQLQLTAAPIESVKISSITFFASGSGNDKKKVSGVRIYDDANNNGSYDPGVDTQIGIEQSYAMDNGSITFKDVNVTFSPGEVKYWLVTYDFNDKASTGEEFKIGLDNACNVICVGTKSSEPVFVTCPPILGETKIIQSYYSVKEKALETGITLAAFDIDGDPTNGYEYYHDFSGQTNLIISIDGNGNGKIDHFIYTPSEDITRTQNTGGTLPTVYWAPSNDIISLLRYEDVNGDGEKDWVYDSDGDGQYDRYLDRIKNTVRLYNTPVENGVHPRIFTPNGDGYNDRAYFYIDNPNNKDVEVKIYDLYGTRVADDLPEDDGIPYWNGNRNGVESGELMQDGPYIYHIKVGNRLYNGVVILAR